MPTSSAPTFDFNRAVALHFSARPTLRQVASEQLLKALQAELPWLAFAQPTLPSADVFMLDSPDPSTPYWTTQPIVDWLLQGFLQSYSVDLQPVQGRHHNLGLVEPYRFYGSTHALDTRQLPDLSASLNALIEQLPQHFCNAQLDYWKGIGEAGVSRDRWIQLLLRTSLLRGLSLQGLDAQEQACIRGVLRGGSDQPPVSFVQASLKAGDERWDHMLCHLLVTGEWDERQVVLWCAPSGTVRRFESMSAFAVALRNELALNYRFDEMAWQAFPVEGDVFAQQAALLLETMFTQVEQVCYGRLVDVAALERLFAQLSDPAQWFAAYPDDTPAVHVPPGISAGSSRDSFAYQYALHQLAIANLDADGVAALDGVHSLQHYARQRLVDRMRLDYNEETSPDDLMLEFFVAHGMPGGSGVGSGGGEPIEIVGEKSLTEFAIGNLGALKNASISRIRHANGEAGPAWLDADAARRLVSQVDIGGTYPVYVAEHLDDPQHRPLRLQRFAREWRSSLWFSALTAKLNGKITDDGLQAVVDFCNGHQDSLSPRVVLIPLAFKRQRQSTRHEQVRGMYLLYCAEPRLVLLYRPLYKQDTLRQYASLGALLEHIQQSPLLQDSILDWMDPQVRHIYDRGGFSEPHLSSIGIDPYALPERPEPPVIHVQYWIRDLDARLYDANRDLLVEIADMQSTSNAERRWETLTEGAWLLFDVVTQVLSGPVASVAWLAQLLGSLQSDLQALERQNEFNRSAAVVDLLLNLGMSLLHLRQPNIPVEGGARPVEASAFEGRAAQRGAFAEMSVLPRTEPAATVGALMELPGRQLDLSWRGNQGLNWIPPAQRQALLAMRSGVELSQSALLTTGDNAGLYLIDGQLYATMAGYAYPVEVSDEGVRVQDGKGGYGPWLTSTTGVWRVDGSLRLAGGMPPRRDARARLQERYENLIQETDRLADQIRSNADQFDALSPAVLRLQGQVSNLKALRSREQAKQASLGQGQALDDSVAMVALYDERLAQDSAQLLAKRDQAVHLIEGNVSLDAQLLTSYERLKEPKFTRFRVGLDEQLVARKKDSQSRQIANNHLIFNELTELIDYQEYFDLQQRLEGQPIGEVREAYGLYRQKLENMRAFQDRMLKASENLDVLLSDTPADLQIKLGNTEIVTAAELTKERRVSTVQLRYHQATVIADLALHLDAPMGQRRIAQLRDELIGTALRNAAGAHGELDFTNLSVEDRISILQEAWDEYTAALLNYSGIVNEDAELVDFQILEGYFIELEKLKLDAGTRLVDAIQEQEGGVFTPRRVAYAVTHEHQQIVRNAEGQLLIGTEREVEGERLLEVLDPVDRSVSAIFDWRDGEWQERQEPAVPLEPEGLSDDTAMQVQRLLDENDALVLKAADYVNNDIKASLIIKLFDRQMKKLNRESVRLNEENANPALIKSLEAAADKLNAEKQLKLITLYTNTKYPTAEALRFLHDQKLLKVRYVERRSMANHTKFDEYEIQRLMQPGDTKGRSIWAAHFHVAKDDALAREFTVGHLKTWGQRRHSSQPGSGVRVHRGKLTLEQAEGIIPFD